MAIAGLTRRTAVLGLLSAVALMLGCARPPVVSPSLHQALEQAEGRTGPPPAAQSQESFGYEAPYAPVIVPPDVRRVWIVTHVNDEGELVQGHWVFLRLTDWQWAIERSARRGPLAVPVPPEASPPPWPAPKAAGRRTVVPWIEGTPTPGRPGAPPASTEAVPGATEPTPPAQKLEGSGGASVGGSPAPIAPAPSPKPAPEGGG